MRQWLIGRRICSECPEKEVHGSACEGQQTSGILTRIVVREIFFHVSFTVFPKFLRRWRANWPFLCLFSPVCQLGPVITQRQYWQHSFSGGPRSLQSVVTVLFTSFAAQHVFLRVFLMPTFSIGNEYFLMKWIFCVLYDLLIRPIKGQKIFNHFCRCY